MYASLFILLILTLKCIRSSPTAEIPKELDACFLVNSPMYCTCDASFPDGAHTVSCYVVSEMSPDDRSWTGFSKQNKIRHLTITSRADSKISYIPTAVLRQIHSLSSFTLRDSAIDTLWPYTFVNMTSLESIKLENAGIRTVEPYSISFIPNLIKVFLVNNLIQRIPREAFYRLPKLKELYLERNSIKAIDDLAFLDLYNLESLELWDNEIYNITSKTFIGLNNLRNLYLYHNRLSRLVDGVFSGAPLLREVDLRYNRLEALSPHAFDGLNHLHILRISNNQISSLPRQIFKGIPNLRMIDITKNKLTSFEEEILQPLEHSKAEFFELFLKENPLICHCDLLWMSKHANAAKSIAFRKELRHLRCMMANSTVLQRITRLSWVDLSCPPEPTTVPYIKTVKFTTESTKSTRATETEEPLFVAATEVLSPEEEKEFVNRTMHSPSFAESRPNGNGAASGGEHTSLVVLAVVALFVSKC